ncbi:MAG: MarR family transcriptional regulator [Acidobacteriota bacterium]
MERTHQPSNRRSALQAEIQQTRPFRSLSQEAVLGLFRTSDMVRRHVAAAIEPEGISMQQYNVLRILRGAGEDGLATLAIAERMIERTPGITRLLDRLEAHGRVARHRSSGDRRRVVCQITPDGLDLLARLDPQVDSIDDVLNFALAPQELDRLIRLLDQIRTALVDLNDPGDSTHVAETDRDS